MDKSIRGTVVMVMVSMLCVENIFVITAERRRSAKGNRAHEVDRKGEIGFGIRRIRRGGVLFLISRRALTGLCKLELG